MTPLFRGALAALLIAVGPGVSAWATDGPSARVDASPAAPSQAQKTWALALGAILARVNGGPLDRLGGFEKTEDTAARARGMLADSWEVTDRASLLETLTWLRERGHREAFDAMAHRLTSMRSDDIGRMLDRADSEEDRQQILTVQKFAPRVGSHSILAWDLGRYVDVCGWGYVAGFLTEQEAWERILPVAQSAQLAFGSWREFGSDYMIGRRFWSKGSDDDEARDDISDAYSYLAADPGSPWQRIPWSLDLRVGATKPKDAPHGH